VGVDHAGFVAPEIITLYAVVASGAKTVVLEA